MLKPFRVLSVAFQLEITHDSHPTMAGRRLTQASLLYSPSHVEREQEKPER